MDWKNHLEKKPDPNKPINSKNQSEIAAREQKILSDKANFSSNAVSHSNFKIRVKKIHAAKPLGFSLHFMFRRDQITTRIWLKKSWKCVNRSYKKKTAPQYNSNSLICNQILWTVKTRCPQ